ncbi:hypothetical protein AGMMS49543_19790 [Betaproteobacteria bacterium]|nr:hypothetical protein AGMMS49543_19790 [Betaproteobacteria bacterium]
MPGNNPHDERGEFQYRFARRHDHDGEHKHRFGVVAGRQVIGDCGRGAFFPDREHTNEQHQHGGPEAKDKFDFGKHLQQSGMQRMFARQTDEESDRKGVKDGNGKKYRADYLNDCWIHAAGSVLMNL